MPELCGCGKPATYVLTVDKKQVHACNKYRRCPGPEEAVVCKTGGILAPGVGLCTYSVNRELTETICHYCGDCQNQERHYDRLPGEEEG